MAKIKKNDGSSAGGSATATLKGAAGAPTAKSLTPVADIGATGSPENIASPGASGSPEEMISASLGSSESDASGSEPSLNDERIENSLADLAKNFNTSSRDNEDTLNPTRRVLGVREGKNNNSAAAGGATGESEIIRRREEFYKNRDKYAGKFVFSNRTCSQILFSDLGFEGKNRVFTGLVFDPYETKDLAGIGFTPEDILFSADLRNMVAAGKIMLGVLKEGDKLKSSTVEAYLNGLNPSAGAIPIDVHSEYFTKYVDFCTKERKAFERKIED